MRHTFCVLAAATLLAVLSGCACHHCGRQSGTPYQAQVSEPNAGVASVAYPYYTTRGPSDFLAQKPQNIGP